MVSVLHIICVRRFIFDLKGAEGFVAQSGAQVVVFNLRVKQPCLAVNLYLDPAVRNAVPVPVIGAFADDALGAEAQLPGQQTAYGGFSAAGKL